MHTTGTPARFAQHQFAGVAVHGADREARQVGVADRDRIRHLLGQHAEAGAEDQRHARREAGLAGADDVGGFEWGIAEHGELPSWMAIWKWEWVAERRLRAKDGGRLICELCIIVDWYGKYHFLDDLYEKGINCMEDAVDARQTYV
jgi:hypothetical protein